MSTPPSPFQDHASPILSAEPRITDEDRASLWDTFHQSKNSDELASKLQAIAVPDDLKHKLWTAKQAVAPPVPAEPVDKVTSAINKMTAMDPKTLDVAESHPNVLKVLTTAATTPEKAAGSSEPSTGGKTPPNQAVGGKNAQSTPLVQPPRVDGQSHFPPIPEDHHRILSRGGVYDIPAENIEKVRAADPHLHVLNP